jgi:hypoxanthine-guanine phosphoribosyltransferase
MAEKFGKPLITQDAMRGRIRELGKQISKDYQGKDLVNFKRLSRKGSSCCRGLKRGLYFFCRLSSFHSIADSD